MQRARQFCQFVEEAEGYSLSERVLTARQCLLALYEAGWGDHGVGRVPDVASEVDENEDESEGEVDSSLAVDAKRWVGFGELDLYWETFDPYTDGEPVAGSLTDDVVDVYRDLRRGLAWWERGEKVEAIWEWRFSFLSHWGTHAIDALRALHRASTRASEIERAG